MAQPEGFDDGTKRVCRLMKTLYGLKQSGCEWNTELNNQLGKREYKNLLSDPCVYIWKIADNIMIITVWVDDLLLFSTSIQLMDSLKKDINKMFEVTDLGEPKKIVGIEFKRNCDKQTLKITQSNYIETILTKYGMQDANLVGTPMDLNIKLEPGDPGEGN